MKNITSTCKISEYKIDTHKSVAFLYISDELSERESKKTIPFKIALKRVKFEIALKRIPKNNLNQGGLVSPKEVK